MTTEPAPTWPIEQATLYVVTYYATNALDQSPSSVSLTMRSYNDAIEKAKELITNASNEGVCTIQLVSTAIVFPSVAWVDF